MLLSAQKTVVILTSDSTISALFSQSGMKIRAKSSKKIVPYLSKMEHYYRQQGYLAFQVDTFFEDNTHIFLQPFVGQRYKSAFISISPEDIPLIEEAECHRFLKHNALPIEAYPAFTTQLMRYLENHGYPFAELQLDSVVFSAENWYSRLKISKNQYITLDSILISGNLKISKWVLYPHLSWRRGKIYSEEALRQISARTAMLPFITEIRSPGVEFVENQANLYLFLDKRKVNRFDGYIGIVPENEQSGKVSVTGQLELNLKNLFTLGETIHLQWISPEKFSQNLTINLDFPYLFRTPIGVCFDFNLEKKDTTHLNLNFLAGLKYTFLGSSSLKAYYNYTSSTLLDAKKLHAAQNEILYIDFRKSLYGLELLLCRLDQLYVPRKGFEIRLNASVGQRNIIKNPKADATLYNNLIMKSLRYQIEGEAAGYIPLHKRWIIVLKINGAWLYGKQLVINELYKIGGMQTLQGFDENSIFASAYLIGIPELRFLFTRNSYIHAFFNGGWFERKLPSDYYRDYPYSFGIGLSFDAKFGIFSLSYALGHAQNHPVSFKTGKIHFGIAVIF
jgi:outer membrane protein assembly factor BamA